MRRKDNKRVRPRFLVKHCVIMKVSTHSVTKVRAVEQPQRATWKRIVRRHRLYRESLQVIGVTRGRDQTATNSTIRVLPRKLAGTGGTERKRSRCQ